MSKNIYTLVHLLNIFECIDDLKRINPFFKFVNIYQFRIYFLWNHESIKAHWRIINCFICKNSNYDNRYGIWVCWCAPRDRCIFVLHMYAHESIRSHTNHVTSAWMKKATTNVRSTLGRWLINTMMRVSAILGFNEHVWIYTRYSLKLTFGLWWFFFFLSFFLSPIYQWTICLQQAMFTIFCSSD